MKPMTMLPLYLLGVLGWNACDAEEAALRVTSTTPDVSVDIRSSDRSAIRLPVLQYEFEIEAVCAAGFAPESVLLSVADTRKRIPAIDLGSDASITIRVPAKQIAPLSAEGFCLESDNSIRQAFVTVRGVLSAQASLLCADDGEQQMTFASQSLDVTLTCETDHAE